jgi:hypothetical protein
MSRNFIELFGAPLAGGSTISTTTWQYFTLAALAVNNTNLLSSITLAPIKNFTIRAQDQVKVNAPADVYDVVSGLAIQGYAARGNVGGAYAILALG